MSFEAMAWAVKQECGSAPSKLTLLMLANHSNGHTGQCNPRLKTLASECEMRVETLRTHIKNLEDRGLLTVIPQYADGVQLPNQYRLNLRGGTSENHTPPPSENHKGGTSENRHPYNQEDNLEDKHTGDATAPLTKTVTIKTLIGEGVDKQVAEDWLTLRRAKRLPLTRTAWADTKAEGEKVGLTPAKTVAHAVSSNWAGFRASWYAKDTEERSKQPSSFAGLI